MNLRNLSRTLIRVSQCLPAGGRPMIQPHPFDIISFQEWGYLCTFCFIKEIQYRKFRWLDNVNIIQWLFTRQWWGVGTENGSWLLTYTSHFVESVFTFASFWILMYHCVKERKNYMRTSMNVSILVVDENWMAVWFVSLLISQASTSEVVLSCRCTNMHKLVGWSAWFRLGDGGVGCIWSI